MSKARFVQDKFLVSRKVWNDIIRFARSPLETDLENYLEEKGVDYCVDITFYQRNKNMNATVELEDIAPKMLQEVILPELRKIAKKYRLNLDWNVDLEEDYYIVSIAREPFGGDKCLVKTITPEDSQT